jgi:hypothetical protein
MDDGRSASAEKAWALLAISTTCACLLLYIRDVKQQLLRYDYLILAVTLLSGVRETYVDTRDLSTGAQHGSL